MQSNTQSAPDNERLFELLAGVNGTYRELLINMINAQATPEMLHKAIESWQLLQLSMAEEKRLNLNRPRATFIGGASFAGMPSLDAEMERVIRQREQEECLAQYDREKNLAQPNSGGAWVPESYTPEEVQPVENYLQQISLAVILFIVLATAVTNQILHT